MRLSHRADEPLELELVMAEGGLWIVQARPLVLAVRGMLQVALEAVREKRASAARLLRRISLEDLALLVETRLPDPSQLTQVPVIARGLAASPGVGSGRLVFDLERALRQAPLEPVVLVRRDALPEDVAAFRAACAIVTTSGGLTSHAAVIARGLRIPAAIGCTEVRLDPKAGGLVRSSERSAGEIVGREGDLVTVDGHRGIVYAGVVPSVQVAAKELRTLCAALQPRRSIALLALGPSAAAQRAYEECALDGIWDPQAAAHVCGPATVRTVQVVGDFATDSPHFRQAAPEALACPPEQAARWVLWLGQRLTTE
jgi:pyruvate, orthophosphate dikinase